MPHHHQPERRPASRVVGGAPIQFWKWIARPLCAICSRCDLECRTIVIVIVIVTTIAIYTVCRRFVWPISMCMVYSTSGILLTRAMIRQHNHAERASTNAQTIKQRRQWPRSFIHAINNRRFRPWWIFMHFFLFFSFLFRLTSPRLRIAIRVIQKRTMQRASIPLNGWLMWIACDRCAPSKLIAHSLQLHTASASQPFAYRNNRNELHIRHIFRPHTNSDSDAGDIGRSTAIRVSVSQCGASASSYSLYVPLQQWFIQLDIA